MSDIDKYLPQIIIELFAEAFVALIKRIRGCLGKGKPVAIAFLLVALLIVLPLLDGIRPNGTFWKAQTNRRWYYGLAESEGAQSSVSR